MNTWLKLALIIFEILPPAAQFSFRFADRDTQQRHRMLQNGETRAVNCSGLDDRMLSPRSGDRITVKCIC
jgi:hypothetical protein